MSPLGVCGVFGIEADLDGCARLYRPEDTANGNCHPSVQWNILQIGRRALPKVVDAGLLMLPRSRHSQAHVYHPCVPDRRQKDQKSQIVVPDQRDKLVLRERIELSTSPLPRECSTTELPQPLMAGFCHIEPASARPSASHLRKPAPTGFADMAAPQCWLSLNSGLAQRPKIGIVFRKARRVDSKVLERTLCAQADAHRSSRQPGRNHERQDNST